MQQGGFDGTLTLAVDVPPPKRVESVSATNFQTFFSGSDGNPLSLSLCVSPALSVCFCNVITGKHTIAIVAHYDSSAPAPTLARGASSNGGGMVLLFALVRLFRTLYDDETTRPSSNLMFVLTAGGHNNYAGTAPSLSYSVLL